MSSFKVQVDYRGRSFSVLTTHSDPCLEELGRAVAAATGTAYQTVKLLFPGKRPVVPSASPQASCALVGVQHGDRAMLMASPEAEVLAVQRAQDAPRMAGFEQEVLRAARRVHGSTRRGASSTLPDAMTGPSGDFSFGGYRAWEHPGLSPPPSEALRLLHRLASDPGIVHVMRSHMFKVGLLVEMPPEGFVGVSPVCVLGLNTNQGQEIQLRLRTDDLRGFRKYLNIRATLLHELTHNVHGDHDLAFKTLLSQLTAECDAVHRSLSTARALGGADSAGRYAPAPLELVPRRTELDGVVDPNDVMAATQALSGRTLRQLQQRPAATATLLAIPAGMQPPPATQPTALVNPHMHGGHEGPPTSSLVHVLLPSIVDGAPDAEGQLAEADVAEDDLGADDVTRRYEHYDPRTQQAELAVERLQSMEVDVPTAAGDEPAAPYTCPALQAAALPVTCAASSSSTPEAAPLSAQRELPLHTAPSQAPGSSSMTAEASPPAAISEAAGGRDSPSESNKVDPGAVQEEVMAAAPAASSTGLTGTNSGAVTQHVHAPSLSHPVLRSSSVIGLSPTPADTPPACRHLPTYPPSLAATLLLPQHATGLEDAHARAAAPADLLPSGSAEEGVEGMMRQKFLSAWHALRQGCDTLGGQVDACGTALDTLATLLRNLLDHPMDPRFQQVKTSNTSLRTRLGASLPASLDVLRVAGFTECKDAAGAAGAGAADAAAAAAVPAGCDERLPATLRWTRQDAGLVWLTLSAVQEAVACLQG